MGNNSKGGRVQGDQSINNEMKQYLKGHNRQQSGQMSQNIQNWKNNRNTT